MKTEPRDPPCPEWPGPDSVFTVASEPPVWRAPYRQDPYQYPFRTCSYCGSIHPEDALEWIAKGAALEGTTKSYKLYVRIPNPIAGKTVRVGSRSGPVFDKRGLTLLQRLTTKPIFEGATIRERINGRYDRPTYGEAPAVTHAKLYSWHLTPEQLERLRAPR